MAVMKSPGDGGQVFQADRNVVRSLLKNWLFRNFDASGIKQVLSKLF
jgi:hypothetical protein